MTKSSLSNFLVLCKYLSNVNYNKYMKLKTFWFLKRSSCHAAVTEEKYGTTQDKQRIIYQHKIDLGITNIEHYGLALAARTHLPEETVNLATELAEIIAKNTKPQDIDTLNRTDDALLYKLNADVKLESRKHVNANAKIKSIIEKFKQDNTDLIRRIRIETIVNTIAVHSDTPSVVSSKQDSLNNAPDGSNIDFNISDTPQNMLARDHTNVIQNNSTVSPSVTMDDEIGKSKKCTIVKSSTELLNTYTNIEESAHNGENLTQNSCVSNDALERELNMDITSSTNSDDDNVNVMQFTDLDNDGNKEMDDDFVENPLTDNSDAEDEIVLTNSSDSSNIADELTQIIGLEATSPQSKTNSTNISIDEELMTETVNEINEELLMATSVENLILTPPCGFKDC